MSHSVRVLGAAVSILILLGGCGVLQPGGGDETTPAQEETDPTDDESDPTEEESDPTEEETDPAEEESEGADVAEGPFVKEGFFGTDGFEARVSIHGVERWDDRSILRFTVEALDGEDGDTVAKPGAFDCCMAGGTWPFGLVDTVGQVHYAPLRNADEENIGSEKSQSWIVGAEYEMEVHFPPLPDDVESLSVHTGSSAGEYAGIPVLEGEEPELEADHPRSEVSSVEPGDRVRMELGDTDIAGDPEDRISDLYSVVEHPDLTRSGGNEETTVGLHADVLFEFGEAELTSEATRVLDGAVEEIRSEADPEQGPVTIVGHTDSQGSDSFNQDLSEKRAAAVEDFLSEKLGSDFDYETEGRGERELIADEKADTEEEVEEARAANRRVEISYSLPPEEDSEPAEDEGSDTTDGEAAAPSSFRSDDGDVVDSGSAQLLDAQDTPYDLDVYPMYRDGAYLVGVFELAHGGSGSSISIGADPLNGNYRGGELTAFSVGLPDDDEVLRAVRVGPAPEDGDESRYVSTGALKAIPHKDDPPHRVFAYFPAPEGEVTEVDLDAGPFGTFEGVPVE